MLRALVRRLLAPRLPQLRPLATRSSLLQTPWILPLLPRSRSLLGYNRAPAAQVVSAFAHELDRSLHDCSLTFGDVVCRGQSAVGWMACSCRCSSLSDRFRSSSVLGSSKLGPTEAVVHGWPMSSGDFLEVA